MDTNRTGFRAELETLINSHSKENGSNTPDFILADYMADCLDAYDKAVTRRTEWYRPEPKESPNGPAVRHRPEERLTGDTNMPETTKENEAPNGPSDSKAMLDGDYAPTHVLRWERRHMLDCAGLPCIRIQETPFAWVLMQLHESPYVGYYNIWKPVMPSNAPLIRERSESDSSG